MISNIITSVGCAENIRLGIICWNSFQEYEKPISAFISFVNDLRDIYLSKYEVRNCFHKIPALANFCPACGIRVKTGEELPEEVASWFFELFNCELHHVDFESLWEPGVDLCDVLETNKPILFLNQADILIENYLNNETKPKTNKRKQHYIMEP